MTQSSDTGEKDKNTNTFMKKSKSHTESLSGIHPVERSFYSPIINLMEDLGFIGIQEIKKDSDYVDILFESGKNKFILEVKIKQNKTEGSDPFIRGIVQAYRYGLKYGTNNIMVVSYPPLVKEALTTLSELAERALSVKVEAILLTDNWYTYETKLTVEDLLSNLKSKIDQKITAAKRVESTSAIIQKCVVSISRLLNKYYKDDKSLKEATTSLTKDYGLFLTLSSTPKNAIHMRNQTIDLLAYILVTQILFYFLFSKKSQVLHQTKKVDEIIRLKSIDELDHYFNQIRQIDYRPIYDIHVIGRIPYHEEILDEINNLIECLTPLQVNEMRHDLYGRLIGNSLPRETRKILASYYTKTSSADLLTNLTIDAYDNTVWDLACGSGTLLVSSYDRKLKLYQKEKSSLDDIDKDKLHRKFVEEDITGTDIMPFACHLTGLNLSAKNLQSNTNLLRVSNFNSLSIESLETPITIDEAYGDISAELNRLSISQKTIDIYFGTKKENHEEIKPKQFLIEKVDNVIINPPFTSINKLPKVYRKSFTLSSLSEICGKRIHLWGYFLALSDKVLSEGGRLGAIIPINILHGKDTHQIVTYYLKNYSIEYIVKPSQGTSFSEDSEFIDILFIARKTKPDNKHKVKFVCLKKNIDDVSTIEIESLAKNISTELDEFIENDDFLLYTVPQNKLLDNSSSLMRYIFTSNGKVKTTFEGIVKKLEENSLFTKISQNDIHDGHQLRPAGTAAQSLFTRNINAARITRSDLIFTDDDPTSEFLEYLDLQHNKNRIVKKSKLVKTVRTITGINVLDASKLYDYMLKEKSHISKISNVVIPNRFRLNTSGTYLTAVYFGEALCPYNTFMMYMCSKEDAKILILYLNSVFYLIQFLMLSKQSTKGFLDIRQNDLLQILIPNLNNLSDKNRCELLDLFKEFHSVKLEDLPSQLANKNDFRIRLDRTVAKCLGIKINTKDLKQIYELVYGHITKERN